MEFSISESKFEQDYQVSRVNFTKREDFAH